MSKEAKPIDRELKITLLKALSQGYFKSEQMRVIEEKLNINHIKGITFDENPFKDTTKEQLEFIDDILNDKIEIEKTGISKLKLVNHTGIKIEIVKA